MADVDTAITSGAGNAVLGNLGQIASTVNAVNQTKLFMAKQAAGALLQRSIDPATGRPDLAEFNRLLARDPRTAPYAAEALTTSLAQQTTQRSLQAAQGDAVRLAVGSLGPNANHDTVLGALRILADTGQVEPAFAATLAGSLPEDPTQINAWARNNFQLPALGAQGALEATTGPVTQVNRGPEVALIRTPALGEPKSIGSVPMGLSPSESVAPAYQRYNPVTKQMETVTKGAAVAAGSGQPGADAIPAAPPLGTPEAEVTTAQGAATLLNADRADSAGSGQRITILKKVNDLLGTKEGQTGPGTQVTNSWRSFVIAQLPLIRDMIPGGLTQAKVETATQDELKKYMTQIAGAAASQYGAGTNEKLAVAASGNANPDLSTLANRDVTRMNIALERAKQARLAAFDASGQRPQDYGRFSTTWNRTIDPRAFMLDLLTKDERAKLLASVKTDAEKRAFLKGRDAAVEAGLYSMADIPR